MIPIEGRDFLFRAELINPTDRLIEDATKEAKLWTESSSAEARAVLAINKRVRPYIEENLLIAQGFSSVEYLTHVNKLVGILGTRIGANMCSDGRLPIVYYLPPVASGANRVPGGFISTLHSSFHNDDDLSNTYIKGAIASHIKFAIEQSRNPEVVEIIGSHFDSAHPGNHGCGALGLTAGAAGFPKAIALEYGGIGRYFNIVGNGFYSYDKIAENAGGKASTFSGFQDTHSAGWVFGLRESLYDEASGTMKFNRKFSLRENLIYFHNHGQILMTELLAHDFQNKIEERAKGIPFGDFRDPASLSRNLMNADRIAMKIILDEESSGYKWIPDKLKEGRTSTAVRTLAFIAMRNAVILNLADFRPGDNPFIKHNETLLRVGPVGADHNIKNVPFIEATPRGPLKKEAIDGIKDLYGLSENFFPSNGVDLSQEARVIFMTGEFDQTKYQRRFDALHEFEETASEVRQNARIIRELYPDAVRQGYLIVIPALYKRSERLLTHILLPDARMDNKKFTL